MKKNWMSSSTGCAKSCLQDMTAVEAETAARCTGAVSRKKISPNIWGLQKISLLKKYLLESDKENRYQIKSAPCGFLGADGNCQLGNCRPESCKKYPYTG